MSSIQFATETLTFDEGPGILPFNCTFTSTVLDAEAAIKSFNFDYGEENHSMRQIQVTISEVVVADKAVSGEVTAAFEDSSKNDMNGTVTVLIIASVKDS